MNNNCFLFERFFKIQKNGIGTFLFGISFFVLEILTFLYYANLESGDIQWHPALMSPAITSNKF